ncbi:MAG: peptide deformylase [Desulfohalobiaceae bacterium]
MLREIITFPDPRLKQQAREIQEPDQKIQNLAQDMAETMYENQGIGLAAPQVGELLSLITVDISGPENRDSLLVLLNPRIVQFEGRTQTEEACLSLPSFKTYVQRAQQLTVQGLDLEGKGVELEADGLLAICLQHEIDHLKGITLVEHASVLKRSMYQKKVKKWAQTA